MSLFESRKGPGRGREGFKWISVWDLLQVPLWGGMYPLGCVCIGGSEQRWGAWRWVLRVGRAISPSYKPTLVSTKHQDLAPWLGFGAPFRLMALMLVVGTSHRGGKTPWGFALSPGGSEYFPGWLHALEIP